ncbi:hypothetical protein [Sporosarcina cyprini]|uniref:hypothetical protein n=1 Tax=Sporosarcina cyprini TaxID=2910523 RepID=UPI001EDD8767|nr:hypothetical protein [Sporosarcina cyprini]MCG3087877.1 hypothetical protein [Sporosarcina cyprini]
MMQHGCCPNSQVQPVVCPTQYRYHDTFIPQEVPYIHPIVNVNRQHMVEIPRHYVAVTNETVMGAPTTAFPVGGYGPGFGPGPGPGFGRRRRFF